MQYFWRCQHGTSRIVSSPAWSSGVPHTVMSVHLTFWRLYNYRSFACGCAASLCACKSRGVVAATPTITDRSVAPCAGPFTATYTAFPVSIIFFLAVSGVAQHSAAAEGTTVTWHACRPAYTNFPLSSNLPTWASAGLKLLGFSKLNNVKVLSGDLMSPIPTCRTGMYSKGFSFAAREEQHAAREEQHAACKPGNTDAHQTL